VRSLRAVGAAVLLPVVLLGAAACSSSDDTGGAAGPASGASGSSASPSESASSSASASASPSGSASAEPGASQPGSPEPADSSTAPPTLAGTSEAEAVDPLPTGHALGTAVLTYSGVGEVREPFEGECWHEGDTTRIQGAAETAVLRLAISPDGARLALDDDGVSATSFLTTGRYEVDGIHLSLSAGLTQDGERVGTVELEIDCGA
jgi:hypothetical protein